MKNATINSINNINTAANMAAHAMANLMAALEKELTEMASTIQSEVETKISTTMKQADEELNSMFSEMEAEGTSLEDRASEKRGSIHAEIDKAISEWIAMIRRQLAILPGVLLWSVVGILISYWFCTNVLNRFGMPMPMSFDDIRTVMHSQYGMLTKYFIIIAQAITWYDTQVMAIAAEIFAPVRNWCMG